MQVILAKTAGFCYGVERGRAHGGGGSPGGRLRHAGQYHTQ